MNHDEESISVCISVSENIGGPLRLPTDCCIYRVHDHLRNVNEKAYQPNIIAIGPYHRGKGNLQMMEEHKQRYLHSLLKRTGVWWLDCIHTICQFEEEVRRCYAELPEQYGGPLAELMVIDSCFIIELVRKYTDPSLRETNDPIFQMDWIVNSLQRDLLLFENQMPFFVLCKLFDMTKDPREKTFTYLAKRFFKDILPGEGHIDNDDRDLPYKHFLELVHNNWLPLFSGIQSIQSEGVAKGKAKQSGYQTKKVENFKFIHCATELKEAGIKFKKGEGGNLFNITFKNGEMRIPQLIIEDRTESFFRNLIAYEEYQGPHVHVVTDYVQFMNRLINSPRDVGILRRQNIIQNLLGNDEVVSIMFNKMTESVVGSGELFHYTDVFDKVNRCCNKPRYRWMGHRWMGILRTKYLNSPWAIISVLAGLILLMLTFLQTLFTIKG